MRGIDRLVLQRLDDHRLDIGISDLARRPRSRLIDETIGATLGEPLPPLHHRCLMHPDPLRYLVVRQPPSRQQHNPGPLRDRMRRLRTTRPPLQHLPLLISHGQRLARTSTLLRHPPSMQHPNTKREELKTQDTSGPSRNW